MPTQTVPIYEVADYDQQIRRGGEILNSGGIVVLPTETVYGAAGVISNTRAQQRLKELRGAESGRPFTIHLASRDDAQRYLGPVSDLGRRMMRKLWPGPVGLMFEVPAERRREVVEDFSIAETDLYAGSTITLRCPDHIVATDVLSHVNAPVVLSMAPTAGNEPARSGGEVIDEFAEKVDLIFDAGPTRYSKPSTILRIHDNRYEIVRTGVYDERIIERLLQTTILFVCSGNTCRSPMAEALTRHILSVKLGVPPDQIEAKGINVISAGSYAMPGARATPQAVEALKELGADLSRHRSKPLSVELIHQADMIFTMGRAHAQAVVSLVPSSADKVATLSPAGEIDDPIGSDVSVYQQLAGELKDLIEQRLKEKSIP